jgi:hypothetical protein
MKPLAPQFVTLGRAGKPVSENRGWGLKPAHVAKRGQPDLLRSAIGRLAESSQGRKRQNWLRAAIAQLVEHLIRNERVGGSNPSCGTISPVKAITCPTSERLGNYTALRLRPSRCELLSEI